MVGKMVGKMLGKMLGKMVKVSGTFSGKSFWHKVSGTFLANGRCARTWVYSMLRSMVRRDKMGSMVSCM